jgi:hypothetical protein
MVLEARQGADFSHFYIFAVAETLSLFLSVAHTNNKTLFGLAVVGWVSSIVSCTLRKAYLTAFSSSRSRA